MNVVRIAAISAFIVLVPTLAGCGYNSGFLIPADIKSVNVQVASNTTFWREAVKEDNIDTAMARSQPRPARPMVVTLTEKVKNEIARRTPLRLKRKEEADSLLITTITRVRNRVLERDGKDNMTVGQAEITVDFQWIDRRTGRVLASRGGISRPTSYHLLQDESFTSAARTSFDYIAEQIVEAMQEGF